MATEKTGRLGVQVEEFFGDGDEEAALAMVSLEDEVFVAGDEEFVVVGCGDDEEEGRR